MIAGGASGNGSTRSSASVARSPSSSFARNGMNHSWDWGDENARNHISQSRRRWYGAYWGGRRRTSPGLALNSYSRHSLASVGRVSRVPSTITSYRFFVTLPNAPYVLTRCSGSKVEIMSGPDGG